MENILSGWVGALVVIPLIKIAIIVVGITLIVLAMNWIERKAIAHMQIRLGPMRVGWHGLLQPVADAIKFLLKEDVIPERADRWVFILAPAVALIPAFIVYSVIPFGPGKTFIVTDINIGILFLIAVSSVGILGIVLGGWASNSKYPLLGALRSSAQMISYEVAMGFAIIPVLMAVQSLSLVRIVEAQKELGWWFVFLAPVGTLSFFLYFFCGVAETNRLPFDLPEAETELVAGFHTEYSGFRFSLWVLAEYANMITVSSLATLMFWGGWLRPFPNVSALSFLDVIPGLVWFLLKMSAFLFLYIWFRATFPRFRFDQLMRLGWKVFLPLGIVNTMAAGVILLYWPGK
ncbi:MAG: NADH-quinone oxidoreductase subunit NuoH [Acidobacteria bacterium]|nr:NADH-quinone oxidoreductase subunit NuoH [Acidobacteriota bacterium]MBI3656858.1 NADH-quinone oxidoreductase subunit NuoH [Acidobacteriota bacterium]